MFEDRAWRRHGVARALDGDPPASIERLRRGSRSWAGQGAGATRPQTRRAPALGTAIEASWSCSMRSSAWCSRSPDLRGSFLRAGGRGVPRRRTGRRARLLVDRSLLRSSGDGGHFRSTSRFGELKPRSDLPSVEGGRWRPDIASVLSSRRAPLGSSRTRRPKARKALAAAKDEPRWWGRSADPPGADARGAAMTI